MVVVVGCAQVLTNAANATSNLLDQGGCERLDQVGRPLR